ncbi:hypothetical protein [Dactylosporangium sp. NPDC051541]|uniref:hypothetical protein n=1 Tax=Dactylosporangium sp. NPDC051541 TaxID=3363977 RepID=UPI00378C4135
MWTRLMLRLLDLLARIWAAVSAGNPAPSIDDVARRALVASRSAGGSEVGTDDPVSQAADDGSVASAADGEPAGTAMSVPQADAFLHRLEADIRTAAELAEQDARDLRARERVLFFSMLVAAVLTFILAVLGVLLAFFGSLAIGIVTAGVAVLPAAGTAALRTMAASLQRSRERKTQAAAEDRRVWQAVHAAMSLPHGQSRDGAMLQLADRFARRLPR